MKRVLWLSGAALTFAALIFLFKIAAPPLENHPLPPSTQQQKAGVPGTYTERKLLPPISPDQYLSYTENAAHQTSNVLMFDGMRRFYQTYNGATSPERVKAVIVLLHGAGRSGVSLVEKWRMTADKKQIFLIGPSTSGRYWPASNPDSYGFIDAVIKDAYEKYGLKPDLPLYLFGHSSGAIYALEYTVRHPEKFDAVAIHAGRLAGLAGLKHMDSAQKLPPITIINGTQDGEFPLSDVRPSAKVLAYRGFNVHLYILEGHTHWYYTLAPYINALAWKGFTEEDVTPAGAVP